MYKRGLLNIFMSIGADTLFLFVCESVPKSAADIAAACAILFDLSRRLVVYVAVIKDLVRLFDAAVINLRASCTQHCIFEVWGRGLGFAAERIVECDLSLLEMEVELGAPQVGAADPSLVRFRLNI